MSAGLQSRFHAGSVRVSLILAIAAAFVGFGDLISDILPSLNPSHFLPDFLDGVVTGLSKLLFIVFLLYFIVSVSFDANIHSRHR